MVIGFYLEHSAGESLVKGDPLIHTYQGPGEYFVERTSDLNLGSRMPVEAIKKELKDLEPLFLKRLRYMNAHEELHYINSKGETVKKFRVLLLRGLSGNNQSLESKIMLENGDFSKDDYEMFKDKVYALRPTANSIPMARNSLDIWFTKNVGLRDWENFELLASINPEFRAIYESYGKEEGFHAAYMLYTGVRRHLRRRMESDEPFKLPERDERKPKTKLQEEIDAICDMIFAEYDDYFKAAIITKIISIETQEEWNRLVERLGTSTVNVYAGKPRVKSYREVNISELLNTESVLKECLGNALYAYFDEVNRINIFLPKKESIPLLELAGYFVCKAIVSIVEISPAEKQMLYEPHPAVKRYIETKVNDNNLEVLMRQFSDNLRTGRADQLLGLPRYSLSDLAEALNNTRSSIPKSYYTWERVNVDITRLQAILQPGELSQRGRFISWSKPLSDTKLKRSERREIEREAKKLEERCSRVWSYLEKEYNITGRKSFLYEIAPTGMKDPIMLNIIKGNATSEGEVLFTRDDVVQILERSKLIDFMKYVEERNFV